MPVTPSSFRYPRWSRTPRRSPPRVAPTTLRSAGRPSSDGLSFTERYLERFRNDPLVVAAVAPHALYTNSDETLKAARALANKYNAPLVIHLSETKKENDDT